MGNIETNDMDDAILDAVDDAYTPDTSTVTDDVTDLSGTSADTTEAGSGFGIGEGEVPGAAQATAGEATTKGPQAQVAQTKQAVVDEFEKKWGIPAQSATGRENRIPHSRVKTMVTKADQEGYLRGLKAAETKAQPQAAQLQEFTTKIQNYEQRLQRFDQLADVIENDPQTFLTHLSQLPTYKPFFDAIEQAFAGQQQTPTKPEDPYATMPKPDKPLPDGTMGYSDEGFRKYTDWLTQQAENRLAPKLQETVEQRVSQRMAPIEQERQQREYYAKEYRKIEDQVAEARSKLPNFEELEPEIDKILKSDPRISLDRAYAMAYQKHIVPRYQADYNQTRSRVLADLRKQPVATTVPNATTRQTQPSLPTDPQERMDALIMKTLREQGLLK